MEDKKKMGRPTDSLKDTTIKIRMDKTSLEMLKLCSEKLEISRAEVIRRSIKRTYEEIQN